MTYAVVLSVDEGEVDSVVAPFASVELAHAWWFARRHLHDEYDMEVVPYGTPESAFPPGVASVPTPGWIAVDLDQTLAEYTTWSGIADIGPPIPRMQRRVLRWLATGKDVRIFTARWHDGPTAHRAIEAWCLQHLGRKLPITATKDKGTIVIYDDRARQVVPNKGFIVGEEA